MGLSIIFKAVELLHIKGYLFMKKTRGRDKPLPRFKALKASMSLVIIMAILASAGTLTIVYSYVSDAPDSNPWLLHSSFSSRVYDRYGNEIAALYGEQKRLEIPLEDVPLHVQNAFIAVEDERFYEHIGIDFLAIARAFLANFRQRSWTEQGGSTITQQLIKNAYLTREKTLNRKVKEVWLALKMEREFSKSEILEMYLNQIYFAHGAYGVEVAANSYFQKKAGELTIAEAALLAGIPRSPNFYSPFVNFEAALQRQALVLKKMNELGFISQEQLKEAMEQEIILADPPTREYPFPYFIDYALHNELVGILSGLPQFGSRKEVYEAIYNMGLKIYTTMDAGIQSVMENTLSDESLYPQNQRVDMALLKQLLDSGNYDHYPEEALAEDGIPQPQVAAVAADPATGEVLALVGGREYGKDNQDLRYLSPRQPGSAIKPIVTYAPALEENLVTPGYIVDDAPFHRGDWAPENFGRRFLGLVTVRESLAKSLNVPAVKVFAQLGPRLGLEYAKRMGLTTIHPDDYNLAATLGGLTRGVTAWDMAQSYAVLANEGIKVNLHTIKRIEDRNGKVLYEHRRKPEAVLSPQTAYLVSDMLKDVVLRGTASGLKAGRPLAAKTGTTSDNRDAYLITYTPEIVVSFWMGHDIQRMGRIPGGSRDTIPFMNIILPQILEAFPPSDFTMPTGLIGPVNICRKSGLRPGPSCPEEDIVAEIFPAEQVPQDTCNLHVSLRICRSSGLLVGNYCPPGEVERRIFLYRPPFERTDERWRGEPGRGPEDAALLPPWEYCWQHTWWRRYRFW
ncbi:MAG: PBP1A family penicillin-binding protein [Desulfobacteraceae bacterium]|jgi:penicillin-binding protein 1A|nr:MAG: PBP1A family penicillin-binding protein [Desulfobacteraceae bacterium]